MQEIHLKVRYFEREVSKSLKLTFFSLASSPFYLTKEKGPGTSDQSLFSLQNKFRKIALLVTYYLTKFDDVIV